MAGTQLTPPAPSSGPASSTPSTSCAPRTSHPPGALRVEQLLVSLPGIGKARATVATSPLVLAVANNVKANTVAELIAYSRSVPQKLNYASAGIGSVSHLTFEVLKTATGIEAVHVPYKGGGPAMNDVIAGHVALNMAAIQVAKGLIDSGKIKGLAVTGKERSAVLPNVPTLHQAGVQTVDVDLGFWFGIFGPKGMPDAAKAKLEKAVSTTLLNPTVRARLAKLDITPDFAPGPRCAASSRMRSPTGPGSSTRTASSRNDVAITSLTPSSCGAHGRCASKDARPVDRAVALRGPRYARAPQGDGNKVAYLA